MPTLRHWILPPVSSIQRAKNCSWQSLLIVCKTAGLDSNVTIQSPPFRLHIKREPRTVLTKSFLKPCEGRVTSFVNTASDAACVVTCKQWVRCWVIDGLTDGGSSWRHQDVALHAWRGLWEESPSANLQIAVPCKYWSWWWWCKAGIRRHSLSHHLSRVLMIVFSAS